MPIFAFGETMCTPILFLNAQSFLRIQPFDVLVDQFSVLGCGQSNVIIYGRYYEFLTQDFFLLELLEAGVLKRRIYCYS